MAGLECYTESALAITPTSSTLGVSPGEQEIFLDMYTQVREEEQIISLPFTRSQEDVSMRRRKKRKQGEDSALIG